MSFLNAVKSFPNISEVHLFEIYTRITPLPPSHQHPNHYITLYRQISIHIRIQKVVFF